MRLPHYHASIFDPTDRPARLTHFGHLNQKRPRVIRGPLSTGSTITAGLENEIGLPRFAVADRPIDRWGWRLRGIGGGLHFRSRILHGEAVRAHRARAV